MKLFTEVEVIIGEYLARRSRGKYSQIITEAEVNNCFSIISIAHTLYNKNNTYFRYEYNLLPPSFSIT